MILEGKLGIDRQPYRLLLVGTRQADGELDAIASTRPRRHVARILVGGQQLVEKRVQLHLTPGATGLDVAQDALQVTDAGSQRLHLAKPAVHLLETIADQPERIPEPLLEGRVQLFVHSLADLVELPRVVALQQRQTSLERQAQAFEALLVAVRQPRQLLREGLELLRLQVAQPPQFTGKRL